MDYCENIGKKFNVTFDCATNSIICDRKIKTRNELAQTKVF